MGDLTGDGVGDIIVGSGVGIAAQVDVYDYNDHRTSSTAARVITPNFSPTVRGGVYVAAGDLNGDGLTDLVMGAGAGGTSQVDVWNGKTGPRRSGTPSAATAAPVRCAWRSPTSTA